MKKFSIKNTVHQSNVDLMHLLISIPDVEKIILEIRVKYKIPEEGFNEGDDLNQWNETTLLKRWEEWDKDTRKIWDRCSQLQRDNRYVEHIRIFILTNTLTAPAYNFAITRDFSESNLGEFKIKIYRSLAKEEKKHLFKDLDLLMGYIDPSIVKKHRPKQGIDEDMGILQNFEKMKLSGNYSTVNDKNTIYYPFESTKTAKDRNEKTYQRRMKEIEERIGWDTSSSN